jgi:hypothetical protein
MSKYTRYHIAKKKFPDYLILFTANNSMELTSCYIDFDILMSVARINKYKFRSFWGIRTYLKKHNISFKIFNNVTIIESYDAIDNNYNKLFYMTSFKKIMKCIKGKYG